MSTVLDMPRGARPPLLDCLARLSAWQLPLSVTAIRSVDGLALEEVGNEEQREDWSGLEFEITQCQDNIWSPVCMLPDPNQLTTEPQHMGSIQIRSLPIARGENDGRTCLIFRPSKSVILSDSRIEHRPQMRSANHLWPSIRSGFTVHIRVVGRIEQDAI